MFVLTGADTSCGFVGFAVRGFPLRQIAGLTLLKNRCIIGRTQARSALPIFLLALAERNCSDPSIIARFSSYIWSRPDDDHEGKPTMASARIVSRLFVLALTLAQGVSLTNAQSLRLGLKGGLLYLVPTKSLDGYQDVYTNADQGFGLGPLAPRMGLEVRYAPTPGGLTFAADASYAKLTGYGFMSWWPWNGDPGFEASYASHLYTLSAGAQWSFLSGPVRPYLGARAVWTRLADAEIEGNDTSLYGFEYWGAAVLGGATVDLTRRLALDWGVRYNFTKIGNQQGSNQSLNPEVNRWFNTYFNGLSLEAGLFFEVL